MAPLKFLNLSDKRDLAVWERLVATRSEALHKCQYLGKERTCPAYENLND